MEDKKSYLQRLSAQMMAWDTEIQKLQLKASTIKAEAQADYQKQLEELRAKRQTAEQKLRELRNTGDDAWNEVKSGVDKSWLELKVAIEGAIAKFK